MAAIKMDRELEPRRLFHDYFRSNPRSTIEPFFPIGGESRGGENWRNGKKSVLERLLKTVGRAVDKIGGINLHTGGGKFIYPRRGGARGTAIRYFDMARVQRETA